MIRDRWQQASPLLVPIALGLGIALPFALRAGVPGLRHDWIWPGDGVGFHAWFIDGFSTWAPNGFGAPQDSPTVNYILLALWLLSAAGLSSQLVLAAALSACFIAGQFGVASLLRVLDIRPGRWETVALAAAYAFGPVCFQKVVAGHLFFVVAYELLPYYAAFCWRALTQSAEWWRSAIVAGLLLSVLSTQIQFLGFGVVMLMVWASAIARSSRVWLRIVPIVLIALLHNIILLVNAHGGNETASLMAQHAVNQWEIDLSAPFRQLVMMGGYVGYDRQALGGVAYLSIYDAARLFFVLLAGAGLLIGIALRRNVRAAVAFGVIALYAVVWANGWYGPLSIPFQAAMQHSSLFTIVRELYHVMALYSLGLTVLAAIAVQSLRRFSLPVAALSILVALPFLTMGVLREVPVVSTTPVGSKACHSADNLCVLLPLQEPLGEVSWANSAGRDPAVWIPQAAGAENGPSFLLYALSRPKSEREALLVSLGIDCVSWRSPYFSRYPQIFEPHVGATFRAFIREQLVLRREYAQPRCFSGAPTELSLQKPGPNILDSTVADAATPPGTDAVVTYSYANNDIRQSWVSGKIWEGQFPALMQTIEPPLITKSAAPLTAVFHVPHGSAVYVLSSASRLYIDGESAVALGDAGNGPYHWFLGAIAPSEREISIVPRYRDVVAIARVVESATKQWRPVKTRYTRAPVVPVRSSSSVPWKLTGKLPAFGVGDREELVLSRTYSPSWRLFDNGVDLGAPFRVHGLFNGWIVSRQDAGHSITVERVTQHRAALLNVIATSMSILLLIAAVAVPRARKTAIV